jgi:hypothetical protein
MNPERLFDKPFLWKFYHSEDDGPEGSSNQQQLLSLRKMIGAGA